VGPSDRKVKQTETKKSERREENYATPLMNVTVDKMEPKRISKDQTQQENEQTEELNFKTRLGTAVTPKYANIYVRL